MQGVFVWVWEETPPAEPLAGVDGYIVRAGNGDGTSSPDGFDFKANYHSWVAFCAEHQKQIVPWTYLYPSTDGGAAANAMLGVDPNASLYVADIEQSVPISQVDAFVDTLKGAHSKSVAFTSYPTSGQAQGQGVPFQECINKFDAFMPQVYYSEQASAFAGESFPKAVYPAIAPDDNKQWEQQGSDYVNKYGTVSIWRLGASAGVNDFSNLHPQPKPTQGANKVEVVSNTQVDTTEALREYVLACGPLDGNGDGWWHLDGNGVPVVHTAKVHSVDALGSDPDVHADDRYWSDSARYQDRDGFALVSVTGAPANAEQVLIRVRYYGHLETPATAG